MNPMWELALGGHATFVVSGIKGLCSSLCEAHLSLSVCESSLRQALQMNVLGIAESMLIFSRHSAAGNRHVST